jgi:hypothetical protein
MLKGLDSLAKVTEDNYPACSSISTTECFDHTASEDRHMQDTDHDKSI